MVGITLKKLCQAFPTLGSVIHTQTKTMVGESTDVREKTIIANLNQVTLTVTS